MKLYPMTLYLLNFMLYYDSSAVAFLDGRSQSCQLLNDWQRYHLAVPRLLNI